MSRNFSRHCIDSGYKKAKIDINKGDILFFDSRIPIGFDSCLSTNNSRKLLIISLSSQIKSNTQAQYKIKNFLDRNYITANIPDTFKH